MEEDETINNKEEAIETINKFLLLIKLTKETSCDFAFKFIVKIKRNAHSSVKELKPIVIETKIFKVVIKEDGASLNLEEVNKNDYYL